MKFQSKYKCCRILTDLTNPKSNGFTDSCQFNSGSTFDLENPKSSLLQNLATSSKRIAGTYIPIY